MLSLLAAIAMTTAAPQDEVLDQIDAFFIALYEADTEALGAMMDDELQLFTLRKRPGRAKFEEVRGTREGFLAGLEGQKRKINEVYWDAKVQTSPAGLATVWVPYYLEYEGAPLHCGVDAFTLVKGDTGWRITNIHDTRDPEGCARLGKDEAKGRMRPEKLVKLLKN